MEALSAIHCEICDSGLNENKLLLCDRCDKGFHLYCLQPKLNSLPTGNWFCHGCSLIKLASLNRLNKTSSSSFNQSKNDNLSTTNHSPTSPAINGSQSNYSPSDTTSNVVTSSSSSSMNQQHRKRPQSPQLNSNQSNMKLCSHKDLVLVSESTILDQTANLNQSISVRPSMNQISTSLNDDDAINTDPGISSSSTQNVTATIDEASDNSDGNSESDSDSDSDLQSIDDVPTLNSPISKAPSSSQATESQEDTIRRVVLTAVTTTGIPRAMYSALPETHPAHFSTDIFLTYIRKLGVSVTEQSKPIIFSILMYLLEVVDENIKSVEGTEGQLPDEKLLLGIMECDQNVGIDSIQVFVDGYDKDSIVSKIRLVDGVRLFLCLDSATKINFIDLVALPRSGLPIIVDGELADIVVVYIKTILQGLSLTQRTFIAQKFYHHLRLSAHLLVSFINKCTFQSQDASPTSENIRYVSKNCDNENQNSSVYYLAYYILHSKFPL